MRLASDDRVGNYRIERELGQTSTGALYQAVHLVLPRRATLKASRAQAFDVQLLREACILEALHHPGAPQVFESGMLADRRPWFAVEKIEGVTLAERIVRGPMSAADTIAIVRDLAEVLAYAHRRGVAHRGLRPDRIVTTPRRRFSLCIPDWSDARAHDAAPAIPHVPTAETRHYVAPELLRGDATDDRADVYALGVIAFLALVGRHPKSATETVHDARFETPPALAALIDQMRAEDRYDRPSSAEVRLELDALALDDVTPAVEDIVLETEEMPRIRRPRWTPPYTPIAEVTGTGTVPTLGPLTRTRR